MAAPPPEYQAPPPPPEYQAPPPPVYQAPPAYQAPPPYGQPAYGAEKPMHMPSLILGIVSIVTCWIPVVPVICGIIGMILAMKKKIEYKTTVGLVLSIIGLVLGIIFLIGYIFVAVGLAAYSGMLGGLM